MSEERWLPVVGYEDRYEVSSFGRVRTKPRILRPSCGSHGYPAACLTKDGVAAKHSVHVLVLEAFVGSRPAGHHACHNNGIRTDARVENLRWGTPTENAADKYLHGTVVYGDAHWNTKVSDGDVERIRETIKFGAVQNDLAALYGVSIATISQIKSGASRSGRITHVN